MYYDTRQWTFVADMNYSGAVTISDIWLWIKWLYFYPGDFIFEVIMNKFPPLARFLEITPDSYGSFWSFIISAIAWVAISLIAFNLYKEM